MRRKFLNVFFIFFYLCYYILVFCECACFIWQFRRYVYVRTFMILKHEITVICWKKRRKKKEKRKSKYQSAQFFSWLRRQELQQQQQKWKYINTYSFCVCHLFLPQQTRSAIILHIWFLLMCIVFIISI